jgi:thiol-disulfide isomerase/thioredoxin
MDKVLMIILLLLLLVLIIHLICNTHKENFTTKENISEDKISLYIFLTDSCNFCKEFDANKYSKLVEEIGDKMNVKKIYMNDDTRDLFVKHKISYVPAAVLEKKDKTVKMTDAINKDNIMREYNKLENNNKKELLIFLSNKCPYCTEYLLNTHKRITDELSNDYNIKLIFSDEDNENLFDKYKVNYVPKAIVKSNNNIYEVKNPINIENIMIADNQTIINIESKNNKKKILVFLSDICPYCLKYENETHDKLLSELNDKYDIEKIYDNKQNESLFTKYKIKTIPKLIILENNNFKELNGEINSENILKTDNIKNIEHMTSYNNSAIINNIVSNMDTDDCKKNKNKEDKIIEEILQEFENENIKTTNNAVYKIDDNISDDDKIKHEVNDKIVEENPNKIIVFLSKTCPGCINYLKNSFDKLKSDFGSKFLIENKFLDENEELFKKYNIEFVPQALVIYNNDERRVEGIVNSNNIHKTIEKLKDDKNLMKMIENSSEYISDDEISYKKINTESFTNILGNKDNNIELVVFLTRTCPHCVRYDKEIHMNLEKQLQNRCRIRRVYADNDKDNLFNKYDIQYVPKGLLLSNERYIPIEGALNNENICKYLDKINN